MRLWNYLSKELKEAYDNALLVLNSESSVRKLACLKVEESCFIVGSIFIEDYEFYKDSTKTIQIALYKLNNQNVLNSSEQYLKQRYEAFLEAVEALKRAQSTKSSLREENVSEAFKMVQANLLLIRQYTDIV